MHSLNPVFADNLMRFQHVGMRSMLRVLVYDRRSALDSRLLGVASLPAAAVPTSSSAPVYMWLPLSPPASRGKGRLGKLQVRPLAGVGQLATIWRGRGAAVGVQLPAVAP